jgi:nucleotide-binding universal stress UspA family protein
MMQLLRSVRRSVPGPHGIGDPIRDAQRGLLEKGEMEMPKKILCATDGSNSAKKAVACAIDLAGSTGAKLTVITVNMIPTERTKRSAFWDQVLIDAANAQINVQLAPAIKAVQKAGIANPEFLVVTGSNAADAIVAYADANKFDHIVVGSSIRNAVERLLVGSTATAVVTRAHCPVTVAR